MTLNEAGKRFHISIDTLKAYEENGLLQSQVLPDGTLDYTETELCKAGLIHSLLKAGLELNILKKYLKLADMQAENHAANLQEQLRILRKQRYQLLEEIHHKQQSLDEIDFMIHNIKAVSRSIPKTN